ncbi:MAG: phytanoyl-CoA dioxygenase family protein [Phenylobacterium sp.]|nr:phytanoyl-CoA dioxygenase family protein [Phenylobacterium sp.]
MAAQCSFSAPDGLSRPRLLWSLPAILWHTDVPRAPQAGCPGVQVFTFLSPVGPGAGGTLVAAGSHRLLNDEGELRSKAIKARLRALPPFARLMDPDHPDRPAAPGPLGEADGVPIEVVELTGAPGDLLLMDMRALHTAAPNASAAPRLMMTWRFLGEG